MSKPSAAAAAAVGEKRGREGDAAAAGERRVHPRSSLPDSDPTSLTHAGAARLPPWLHRHALESVFAFCARRDFSVLPAVCRDWQAAVLSMAPLQWTLNYYMGDRLTQICQSPLRRHVSALVSSAFFTGNAGLVLPLLSARMPHLRELIATVPLQPSQAPPPLPPLLLTLELDLTLAANAGDDLGPLVAALDAAVEAVANLTQLESLNLCAPMRLWEAGYSLAPLARAPRLRNLTLRTDNWKAPPMSDAQLSVLRAMSHLEAVRIIPLPPPLFRRLLVQPHNLRWQQLSGFEAVREDTAQLLSTLPLTALHASLAMPHCDFLAQLPQLTDLWLNSSGPLPLDTVRVLQTVGGCARLRALCLYDGVEANVHQFPFTSAQLGACLSRLPQLEKLEIWTATALTTLDFLGQDSLPRTLTALHLFYFRKRLPLAELQHVLCLGALRTLQLVEVFDASLSDAELRLFNPPTQSPRLPLLERFQFLCSNPVVPPRGEADEEVDEEEAPGEEENVEDQDEDEDGDYEEEEEAEDSDAGGGGG